MLVKPILLSQIAFDVVDGAIFNFIATGGNQVIKNQLTIRDNETNTIVYQKQIETFQLSHILQGGSGLINGNYYNAYINTYDIDGNISPDSNIIQFHCYTRPTLSWSNAPFNNIINNDSYNFIVEYSQIENELFNGAQTFLYDETGQLIYQSEKVFNTSLPPLSIEFLISGLEDNKTYKIQFIGNTINQTPVESDVYTFTANFIKSESFGLIELQNNCQNGYISINTNVQVIEGVSNPTPPKYLNNTEVDVRNTNESVEWNSGYSINGDFVCGVWFKPSQIDNFMDLLDINGNGFRLSLREYNVGGVIQQRAEVEAFYNGEIKIFDYSDFINPINTQSQVVVWLKYVGGQTTVYIDTISRISNFIYWNGESNVEWNSLTDIYWNKDDIFGNIPTIKYNNGLPSINIEKTKIFNGIFDHLYITQNSLQDFTNIKPPKENWDVDTILICDFDNNILGGNVNFILSEISQIHIKRRLKGELNWVTIKIFNISSIEDFSINTTDNLVPSLKTYEYAIVPILSNGTEGNYTTAEISSQFNSLFISDIDTVFKVYVGVTHTHTQTQSNGIIPTLGSRTPFIIKNSNLNYSQGNISGTLLGYNYEKTRTIDPSDIIKQRNDLLAFLTNGKAKIVKDVDGTIYMAEIVNSISNNFQVNGAGFSFNCNYVECGSYDDQQDLYDFGFIEGATNEYNTISI